MSEEKICKECGKELEEDYKICPYCGTDAYIETLSNKNGIICFILWLSAFYVGIFAHRFYINKIQSAVILSIVNIVGKIGLICSDILDTSIRLMIINRDADIEYMSAIAYIVSLLCIIFSFIVWIKDLIQLLKGQFKDSEGKYIKINNRNYIKSLEN